MKFEKNKHYTRNATLKDMKYRGPINVQLAHFTNEDDATLYSIITLDTGACHIHASITSAEARDLATQLQAFAEEVDAHALQLSLNEVTA